MWAVTVQSNSNEEMKWSSIVYGSSENENDIAHSKVNTSRYVDNFVPTVPVPNLAEKKYKDSQK